MLEILITTLFVISFGPFGIICEERPIEKLADTVQTQAEKKQEAPQSSGLHSRTPDEF